MYSIFRNARNFRVGAMDNFVTRGGRPKRGPQTSLESRLAGHMLGIDFDREIRLPPKRARRSYRPSKETMSPRIHRNLIISYRELSQQERECNFDISLQENLPPPNTLSLYNSLNFVPSIAIPLREESGEKICIVIGPRYVYIPPSAPLSPRLSRLEPPPERLGSVTGIDVSPARRGMYIF